MAGRKKPKPLLITPDPTNRKQVVQVVKTTEYFVVVYDDQPINVIVVNDSQHLWTATKRYIKTGYPHKGHATRRAHKLNTMFNTDKFTVKELNMNQFIPQNGPGPVRMPGRTTRPNPNPLPVK
jgi:hypothetical protein